MHMPNKNGIGKPLVYLLGILHFTPEDGRLLHGIGYCFMQIGRLQEALHYLRKAQKADPKDPDTWYDFGLTLARMKKRQEARPCFRKVLQLDANYFWAWYDLACLDALENKPAAAFGKLYKSIERGFRNADYLRKDPDFKSICKDPRWRLVIDHISDKSKIEETNRLPKE
jgi:Flp pilus assembly protein TadD